MHDVVIETPVLNSPFEEPARHFHFTDEMVEGRRESTYFVPIPRPKKRGKQQLTLDTQWTTDRIRKNDFVNKIHRRILI